MNKRIVLIAKFTFSISLILLLFMGMLDYLNLKNFRKVMVDYAVLNAEEVADIITQSTYDAMLKNDKSSLYTMIARISKSENIEHIRLIDQNGKVIYSKSKDEIGSAIGIHADECLLCHYSMQPDSSTLPEKNAELSVPDREKRRLPLPRQSTINRPVLPPPVISTAGTKQCSVSLIFPSPWSISRESPVNTVCSLSCSPVCCCC